MANQGKISFYTFVKELKKLLNSKSLILKAKDEEFASVGFKPLKTSIVSKKLKKMRNWQVALKEYVDEINQH